MKKLLNIAFVLPLLLLITPVQSQNFNVQLRSKLAFPGQTLANICGYTQNGREYALVGGSNGLIIVDVTNPDSPVQIVQIPGPQSQWKEIKTYKNFAYVVTEGGQGVQIVDLSALPSAALPYKHYMGDGGIAGKLNAIHALHIDVKKGFLYTFGGSLSSAMVMDLNADPYTPRYVGQFSQLGYIHDGYAENDTLYAGHIYSGTLSVVNMANKQAPVLLGTVTTPGKFTHNAWLTDDHKTVLTTDEATPSFITAYDVSDPTDIKELDRFSTNDGTQSLGHNVHVRNDWAITSWYTDGVSIVDAHRPHNLVETGHYDTWPGTGAGFSGCWGVYPFFPSGTMVATNISPAELFIFTPNYVRATYVEGIVKSDCTKQALESVVVKVSNGASTYTATTGPDGKIAMGQAASGDFTITVSKVGYKPKTIQTNLKPGDVYALNLSLEPENALMLTGQVVDGVDNTPVTSANVLLFSNETTYDLKTDAKGQFNISCAISGNYTLTAGVWGYLPTQTFPVFGSGLSVVSLSRGYYDDFNFDLGWTVSGNATTGAWVRAAPEGLTFQNGLSNPESDQASDYGDRCFVTGNGAGAASADDVDGGETILSSPVMKLGKYSDARLNFWYWFVNRGQGTTPNDKFEVRVTNGTQTATVFSQTSSSGQWRFATNILLKKFLPLTDNMRLQFVTSDQAGSDHIVEAGIDVVRVTPIQSVGSDEIDPAASISIWPNPSADRFALEYEWPGVKGATLEVRNILGQLLETQILEGDSNAVVVGADWPKGVYLFSIHTDDGRQSRVMKAIKQ